MRSSPRRHRDPDATGWWDVARVLLIGCLVATGVAAWLAFWPVTNPGVQECGSPVVAVITRQPDTVVVAEGDELQRLVAQDPCSDRSATRSLRALLVLGAGVGLGVAGALFGLIDDRVRLHRAPAFESLLRERPASRAGGHAARGATGDHDASGDGRPRQRR
jgi:hypothetical protein